MEARQECCATCHFFCQDLDPDNMLYFDNKSGECRISPPKDHFVWLKTRPYHWCGQWQPKERRAAQWQQASSETNKNEAVLLFQPDTFCQSAGMIVGYWNAIFNKWHDGGDKLMEKEKITHWMSLPKPPTT